ncbi:protein of unknown function [Cardinium endosymbiont cEper1 of Encarsia pergandiella]|uniref:PD-(D/E)XK nuclease family transposase n=1 Tax=Cardinium endosymbiont of Encarsia pergandiella TaxID=249402 RepID=UPI00027EA79F|nr:PD-(D/E)XK nuclease family transposase [Cardinium endosymbiont of Encarsia pergandiella]CCM10386.1 protein of unknown function [Cardinium endosymbiont cEper1 of Encarsia pergandiella]
MVTSKFLNPKNDVAFRKIFGSEKHKNILIHFINDVLDVKKSDKVQDEIVAIALLIFRIKSWLKIY